MKTKKCFPPLFLFLYPLFPTPYSLLPASAHKVKIAEDVGATLHIEPNDNPRAGESAQAWFALTRKGGQAIPLAECNCQLSVFSKPHKSGESPLLQPSLKAVVAERYQGIPGANITFPKPGAYQLQLIGKPIKGANFKPFEFKFEVTVAAGTSQPVPTVTNSTKVENLQLKEIATNSNNLSFLPFFIMGLLGTLALGIIIFGLSKKRNF
jgi:hypothetical protein